MPAQRQALSETEIIDGWFEDHRKLASYLYFGVKTSLNSASTLFLVLSHLPCTRSISNAVAHNVTCH